MRLRKNGLIAASVAALACWCATATAVPITAEYLFNNTLASSVGGAPALVAVDPLGLGAYETQTVYGNARTVYHWDGNASPPSQQAGFTLATTGLVSSPSTYSLELVFEFLDGNSAWRRISDVQNRQSDNGFYVDPANNLDVFPLAGSNSPWTNGVFHHVVLVDANSNVTAYLDGVAQFTLATAIMNLNFDVANNPNQLLGLFVDNTAGGGQSEFSDGRIALARFYNGALDATTIATLARDPFIQPVPPTTVPEPATLLLVGLLFLLLGGFAGQNSKQSIAIRSEGMTSI